MTQDIEQLRARLDELERQARREASRTATEHVLVIGDLHAPFTHPGYLDFCRSVQERFGCSHVVQIGDECFPGHVEVFTDAGFKRFDELDGTERVLQVHDDGTAGMVRPLRHVRKPFRGDLVRHEMKGYASLTTPGHNLVVYDKRTGAERKVRADALPRSTLYRIPRAVHYDGPGIDWTDDEIRLQVAIQADFSEACNGARGFRAAFKRERKKARIEQLLDACGLSYERSDDLAREGFSSFYIHAQPAVDKFSKAHKPEWLAALSAHQATVYLDELAYWDGHDDPHRQRVVFSTCRYDEARFVQALAHRTGVQATIVKPQQGCWRVNLLYGKADTLTERVRTSAVPHDGDVYCVTVPSGRILVRCGEHVSVSGNCDNHAISFHESDPDGMSAGTEAERALDELRRWYAAFPECVVLVGNHGALPFRRAMTHGLPKRFLRTYEEVWEAPPGWTWHDEYRRDGVLYVHGTGTSGQNAAIKRAVESRCSVVMGHAHSFGGVQYHSNGRDMIFGMNVGCGIDASAYAMAYAKPFVRRPTLGCGVVLHNGREAYFVPMPDAS